MTVVNGFKNWDDAVSVGTKSILFSTNYVVTYRVDDKNAALLGAVHAADKGGGAPMSGEAFLSSGLAKDSVKDGKGENSFGVSGHAQLVVSKNASGAWNIIDLQTDAEYDTSDFAQQN